jgi:hypothetical protein
MSMALIPGKLVCTNALVSFVSRLLTSDTWMRIEDERDQAQTSD